MSLMPTPATDALKDRVILITGAYGGLGEASAKACTKAGATVVLLGRKVPKLNRTYDAVKMLGAEPAMYPLDMAGAHPADYETMADKIVAELGGLHGILHCAVEFKGLAPLETVDPNDFVKQLHVGLTAPWLLTQACLPHLKKQDSAVVFVGDSLARVNKAYWGAYGIAKTGLQGMMHSLHDETENTSVRVSMLEPGTMRTSIRSRAYIEEAATNHPSPEKYAPACVHLLSEAGREHRGQIFAPRTE
jgi:NAD(P)-dependent dehydrogenase (short-subunit alcohol dehydrogenase family)